MQQEEHSNRVILLQGTSAFVCDGCLEVVRRLLLLSCTSSENPFGLLGCPAVRSIGRGHLTLSWHVCFFQDG